MASRTARTTPKPDDSASLRLFQRALREGLLILVGVVALFMVLALGTWHPADPGWTTTGQVASAHNLVGTAGAFSADVALTLLGLMAWVVPVMLAWLGWKVVRKPLLPAGAAEDEARLWLVRSLRTGGFVLVLLGGSLLFSLHLSFVASDLPAGPGGWLGNRLHLALLPVFNLTGTTLLGLAALLAGASLFTGISWLAVLEALGRGMVRMGAATAGAIADLRLKLAERREQRANLAARKQRIEQAVEQKKTRKVAIAPQPKPEAPSKQAEKEKVKEKQRPLFVASEPTGPMPALGLLDEGQHGDKKGYSTEALEAMSRLLEIKLKDFNIDAEVTAVHPGPVITRFEIQPAAGVKVARITALAKDLARSLAVISVRIVEVIPGKSTVGIEIPNEDREIVRLRDVLASQAFDRAPSPLTLALGKDISGHSTVADLAKMPHLLVAGTTGSGKSVGVNAMLLSILYKSSPEEVRLILVDPKMLELSVYDGIPHLLTPVVTDMKDAASALRWCVGEMERRYKLMAAMGVRNLGGFNRKVREAEKAGTPLKDPLWMGAMPGELDVPEHPDLHTLPFIVVVIDEFADMMMIVGKKVEELIARIAQKARAAGIHLVLATQRPSVDVITGLIKANIPTRIAFQVSSKVDSRTILDQGGAEQLLGHGDMLYLPPGTAVPNRVHGAFVGDEEVHRVVADWKARGAPDYLEEVVSATEAQIQLPGEDAPATGDVEQDDELYDEAVQAVLETRRASISGVQRKLRIGYNRAARLIEAMEAAGVVSEMNAQGQREVLVPHRDD